MKITTILHVKKKTQTKTQFRWADRFIRIMTFMDSITREHVRLVELCLKWQYKKTLSNGGVGE